MHPDGLRDGLVIIVCPLEIERSAVARSIQRAAVGENLALICSGPGPDAVRACLSKLEMGITRAAAGPKPLIPHLAILAGLAGGLIEPNGKAIPRIGRVLDGRGGEWTTWEGRVAGARGTILGLDAPVLTPDAKQALHSRTGAAMVDTESHAFARVCEDCGIAWAVVRGISDGPRESLPEQAPGWIDGRGRTRVGRVMLDVARRPRLVGDLRRLGAASSRVLPLVGDRVVEIIRAAATLERR